ncbi:alpha-amylase family glycosyl hydrolase [Hoeflea sp. YIM 152468]|uniref:beta-galactosidase BglA n=1 Tax=Hoeflea sp. YIM 152468 TaxID=3031759 RepID=UPI0023DC24B7|nr:alpha-amylase family glycosyl hydrolase [Hoeflea sp. YIM 152468]MDF1609792.1 alpha-amylase family glycosyl hydrolase [Hoeflea sp. YIM 152468]
MGKTQSPEWWRGCVIYQVYPRSFQDTSGDGIGDIRGIINRLDHIASLGVDAIWLSPFFKSPMADFGYDVSDYCDVDPMFGTLSDFDELIECAHARGLKIIIDQVISHSSDQHAWFQESRTSRDNPKADWYVWADAKPDGTAPNNWLSVFGGPSWEWDTVRRQYYMHNFLASQPDLNFHNGDVQSAILDTVRFWLDRGVDGFRLDTVNFYVHDKQLRDNPPLSFDAEDGNFMGVDAPDTNPYGFQDHLYDKSQPENIVFLQRLRALLDSYEGRTTVGEVGDGRRSLKTVAAYTNGGDKLHMCYTFDMLGGEFSAEHFRRSIANFQSVVKDGWVCWAFSNHDVERHVSRWTQDGDDPEHLARLAITLLSSFRGSICLYQGEELGLNEADIAFEDLTDPYGIRFWPAYKGRDGCRTPMVWEKNAVHAGFSDAARTWLPIPEAHLRQAVDQQHHRSGSLLNHYRNTLTFRKSHASLVDGPMAFLKTNGDLLAFIRGEGSERLLFVFNLGRRPVQWTPPSDLAIAEVTRLPGFAPVHDGDTVTLAALDVFCARLS